jgi:hypothetical protein
MHNIIYPTSSPSEIIDEAQKAAWLYDSLDNYPWPFGHHAGPEFKAAFDATRAEIARYNATPAKIGGAA